MVGINLETRSGIPSPGGVFSNSIVEVYLRRWARYLLKIWCVDRKWGATTCGVVRVRPSSPSSCVISWHQVEAVNRFTYLNNDADSSGNCTPEILRRISIASAIMSQLDRVWRQSRLSNTTKVRIYITAICFWNMDTTENWYSETGGLSYDKPKANTWHPLIWKCYECGSRHPLTAADHKGNYKSKETFSLWPRQTYGSGGCCPPSPTSLHVTTGLRRIWHLEETTRSSAKMLGGAGHHKHRALSFRCLEYCDVSVSMEGATTRRRSSAETEKKKRERAITRPPIVRFGWNFARATYESPQTTAGVIVGTGSRISPPKSVFQISFWDYISVADDNIFTKFRRLWGPCTPASNIQEGGQRPRWVS